MKQKFLLTGAALGTVAVASFVLLNPVEDPDPALLRFSGGSSDGHGVAQLLRHLTPAQKPSKRFAGSDRDGFGSTALLQFSASIPPPSPRFAGHSLDGHASANWLTHVQAALNPSERFSGGHWDGFAKAFVRLGNVSLVNTLSRFFGGGFDGHGSVSLRAFNGISIIPPPRFFGGSLDGSAVSTFLDEPIQLRPPSGRYSGGPFDGSTDSSVRARTPDIVTDTDHDGLPDWWESRHFGTTTNAQPQLDLDKDGASAWEEYAADTDPNDTNSVFRITDVQDAGTTITVTFKCSPLRVYSLATLSNLVQSAWSDAVRGTRADGSSTRIMSLEQETSGESATISVVVDFP